MIFVRNPTGVSHSPAECAERDDCLAGVDALTDVLADLTGAGAMIRYWARTRLAARRLPVRRQLRASTTDRFAEVRTGTEPQPRRRAAARRRAARASPTPTATRSTGPCAAGRTSDGGTFWTWREQMYAVAARLDPDSYFALARAVYAEMVAGRLHRASASSTTCTTIATAAPYADPNAMGAALIAAAAEAGIRLTLLDTCYLAGGLDRRWSPPLDPVQRRSPTAPSTLGRAGRAAWSRPRTARIGAAVHSVRAVPGAALASVGRGCGDRPLHVHLSEQPAENAAYQAFYGCTPTELLDAHGLLGRTHHRGARDPPHATPTSTLLGGTRTAAASARPPSATSPTASARPGGSRDAGSPLTLGSDQHAVIDPFEELRGLEMHERLTSRRARPVHARRS